MLTVCVLRGRRINTGVTRRSKGTGIGRILWEQNKASRPMLYAASAWLQLASNEKLAVTNHDCATWTPRGRCLLSTRSRGLTDQVCRAENRASRPCLVYAHPFRTPPIAFGPLIQAAANLEVPLAQFLPTQHDYLDQANPVPLSMPLWSSPSLLRLRKPYSQRSRFADHFAVDLS